MLNLNPSSLRSLVLLHRPGTHSIFCLCMFNGAAQGRGGTAATVGLASSALLWLAVVQVVFLQEFPRSATARHVKII